MRISLFNSCIVEQLFPDVGFAALHVLQKAGAEPVYNDRLACCGQPAFNSGHRAEARRVGASLLDAASDEVPLVAISGSCAAMIKVSLPRLFDEGTPERESADALASRTWEFSDFLVNQLRCTDVGASFDGVVAYHDSCHALRELGVSDQPRRLIAGVKGARLCELDDDRRCCGFGGLFSVGFSDVSVAIGRDKIDSILNSGASCVVSSDVSCLMQIDGLLKRNGGNSIRTMHLAELLDHREPPA